MADVISAPFHAGTTPVERRNYLTEPKGLWSWLATVDHKRIGIMYLISVMAFFLVGGIFALLIRLSLFDPSHMIFGHKMLDAETYNKVFTMHGVIMVFLFIIPSIPAALGNFVLPLQLGAKDVAFPRLNLMSWYIAVFGGAFGIYALVAGGVDTGWTFYTPYSARTDSQVIPM